MLKKIEKRDKIVPEWNGLVVLANGIPMPVGVHVLCDVTRSFKIESGNVAWSILLDHMDRGEGRTSRLESFPLQA